VIDRLNIFKIFLSLLNYTFISALALVVDLSILIALSDFDTPWLASTFAYLIGACFAFLLLRYFKIVNFKKQLNGKVSNQLMVFLATGSVGILTTFLTFYYKEFLLPDLSILLTKIVSVLISYGLVLMLRLLFLISLK
jgi:fluoride ion exporter CrcB/FEX